MARDPFSWAAEYNNDMTQLGARNEENAQNTLMRMFLTEASRQAPWSDLPVDLAKQNNYSQQMMGRQIGVMDYKNQNGPLPKDIAAFSNNLIEKSSKDLGISPGAAAGLVGNLASETGNFKYMQELKPVVPGSKGGAGWAMWTGPRRDDFERFTGGDTTSPEANYAYLIHDLKQNYPQVLAQLQQTDNPMVAAQIIHDQYLIPGVKHLRKSAVSAQQLYAGYNTGMVKREAGDAEYDRRQARKKALDNAKKDTFTYGGKTFSLTGDDNEGEENGA